MYTVKDVHLLLAIRSEYDQFCSGKQLITKKISKVYRAVVCTFALFYPFLTLKLKNVSVEVIFTQTIFSS